MATYTVIGHPINPSDIPEPVRAAVMYAAVGATVVIVLNGADDTKAKGHGALR